MFNLKRIEMMKKEMEEIRNADKAYVAPDITLVPLLLESGLLAAVSAEDKDKVTEDPIQDTTGDDPFNNP
jgi:hypothetical protein